MTEVALYIGRFQPLHNGHLAVIQEALEDYEQLIVGIGSPNRCYEPRHPFTYDERHAMITRAVDGMRTKIGRSIRVLQIDDVENNNGWVDNIERYVKLRFPEIKQIDCVYTNNPLVEYCFKKEDIKVVNPKFTYVDRPENSKRLSSTFVRAMMMQKDPKWKNYVPDGVARYLEYPDFPTRMEMLKRLIEEEGE